MPMIPLPITALYAGLRGFEMLVLAALVSGPRMRLRSSIRIDDTPQFQEAVRRNGNFIEWVPFVLLLMAIAELNGLRNLQLHVVGALLVVARVFHPLGVWQNVIPPPLRAIGGTLTFFISLYLSAVALWQSFHAW